MRSPGINVFVQVIPFVSWVEQVTEPWGKFFGEREASGNVRWLCELNEIDMKMLIELPAQGKSGVP